MFHGCSSLEIINLKSSIISNDFINKILSITSKNLTICSDIEISGSTLIFEQEIICNGISNNELYENRFKCYVKTISEKYNKYSCEICGKNLFQKYNTNSLINCDNSAKGYYLDLIDSLYKPCYTSCKTCDKIGTKLSITVYHVKIVIILKQL